MPLDEPGWWYREDRTVAARILSPLSAIWGVAAERRYRRGESWQAPYPIICVGNFTVGGTGKTPLSLHIARLLFDLGAKPAFLTRGYGGRTRGPHWVASDRDAAADVGDEPLLLASVAPTMVARDRAAGARAIASADSRYGAIVMDDGLQNGALAKDLTIAVVDSRRGIGNGLVMPAGPLRARLAFQLGLVDAVVVNGSAAPGYEASSFIGWLRQHFGGPVLKAVTRPEGDTAWVTGSPVLAYSGIGAPGRFFDMLSRLGADLAGQTAFPDHHSFSEREAQALLTAARGAGATLCTTEKDWVRLPLHGVLGELRSASRILKIGLELEPRDEERLRSLVETSLAARRPLAS